MIRVLHILDSMEMGGIQSFILNIYRSIDNSKMQFDFLLHREMNNENEKEIKRMGGNIYFVPTRRKGIKKNKEALKDFFKQHTGYDAIHFHISSLSYVEPLMAAKKAGIPVRIVHSHSSQAPKNNKFHIVLHEINKRRLHRFATHYFSCSDRAAQWFYGNTKMLDKSIFIPNGIQINEYAFDPDVRKAYRKEFQVEDRRVIGHVGRFQYPKNHEFLIELFRAYARTDDKAVLMLVGDGENRMNIEKVVGEYGLSDKVFFLGSRNDVNKILQMFDLFILPSRYEGFPVTMVEAQASSLPCIVSDTVTHSVDISGKVRFCKLSDSMEVWINNIREMLTCERDLAGVDKVRNAGYDMKDIINNLFCLYCNK